METKKKTIETWFSPSGSIAGSQGCWKAKIVGTGITGAGTDAAMAVRELLRLAPSHKESGNRDDYEVVEAK